MRWITADTHFGHANIIAYCDRPFPSVEAHDEALVRRWNACVAWCDEVFHLGDFALSTTARMKELVGGLHGKKYLVRGNHDRSTRAMQEVGFNVLPKGVVLEGYALVHDPKEVASLKVERAFCGHVHEKWKIKKWGGVMVMNVGVDVWDFTPLKWEEAKVRWLVDGAKEGT